MPTRLTHAQAVSVLSKALALLPTAEAYIQSGPHFENAKGAAVGPHSTDKVKYSLFGAIYVSGQGLVLPRQPPYPPQFITADVVDLLGDIEPGMRDGSRLDYVKMRVWVIAAIVHYAGDETSAQKAIDEAVPPKPGPLPVAAARAEPPQRPSRATKPQHPVSKPLPSRGPSHQNPSLPQKFGKRAVPARRPQLPVPHTMKPGATRAPGSKR